MKILGYVFFLGFTLFGSRTVWAQSPDFTVSGRKCIPEGDCGGDSTVFRGTGAGVTAWLWNFGDPSAPGKEQTSNRQTARHLYLQLGQYTVTLTVTRPNKPDSVITKKVSINDLPLRFEFFKGKEDTTICPGTKLLLDPYEGMTNVPANLKYSWYPTGDTTRTILADKAKCYSVEVKNDSGCSRNDRINVKICGENDQQQAAKWYFGANAGIEFKGGQPSAVGDGKVNTPEGVSAISDKQGNLLFYTDGITVYDKDGKPIRYRNPADSVRVSGKLGGSGTSTQSALIVPQPACRGCETIYYIFTTNDSTQQLSYTIIDMRGNKGKGEIVEPNIPLHGGSTERVSSVQNPKDSTYWVVTRDTGSNVYRFYRVTKNGVVEGPTKALGLPSPTKGQAEGYLKFSNNGKKIALIVPGPPRNYVEVYDFNDTTGAMRNKVTIDLGPSPPTAYGVEFSPDGTNMFVSLTGDGTTPSQLIRYNVENMDSTVITLTKVTLDSTSREKFGALQYAPDGKIYLAIDNSTSLGVINNPDSTTVTGIEFVKNGFNLDGKRSLLGLPNFVQSIIQPPSGPGISYSDTCFGTPTQFSSGPICDPLKDKYAWDFGDGTTSTQQQPTHLYKAPGSYTVKLRLTNNCKDTTMSASLVIKPTPIAKLGPDKTVCARSVELDAGNTVPGQFLYLWIQNDSVITGARGPKLSVTRSGTYTVLIANTDGDCVVGDTIRVNLTLPKPISLGADTVLCSGQRLNLEVKNQTAGATYLWSNNTTASTLTVSQPGTYIVTVTDRSQGVCTNADTIVVRGGNKPNFTARIQDASGCLTTDGSITIENISPQAGYRFIWSTNGQTIPTSVTSQLDGLKVGTYGLKMAGFDRTIQITCTLDTTFVINAKNPDLQVALANLANANCLAPNTGSIALRIVKGVPTTYIWRNAAGAQVPGGQTLSGVPAGTYSVEVSDATGCKFSLSNLVVRLNPSKFVELGPDSTRCAGDPITLDAGNQGDSYRWSTGATTRTINITQTGTYTVTVSDSRTRCESSDTVRLTINPKPTIVVGPTQIVCANAAPLVLNATPAGGSWNGNGVTPEGIFRPSQLLTGPITLTYSVNQRGCVAQANKTLTVQPIPDVSLGPDRSYCTNSPQTLSIPELPGATYRWSTGETTTSIIPKRTGTYSVSVALGSCRDTDTVRIEVLPSPILSVKAEVPLCAVDRDTVTLDAGGLPGYRYNWNPIGATTRRIRVEQTGVYTVRVTNAEGCTEERPVTVFDECEPRIVVPDIFTPNGDGLNDRLDVYVAHITDYELRIYNRWGEMLFRTSDVNEKWDGTYKGVRYPTQSYAWVVAYKSTYFPERPTAYKRGAVMLVR